MVRILLGREEVNPEKPDYGGRVPHLISAGSGHEGVVKMLLIQEEVNPDKPDMWSIPPLSYAA